MPEADSLPERVAPAEQASAGLSSVPQDHDTKSEKIPRKQSRSNLSISQLGSRIQQKPYPHSSDSLLHELHTNPNSSHITVCAATSTANARHPAPQQADSMLDLSDPLQSHSTDLIQSGKDSDINSSQALGLMGKPVDIFAPSSLSDNRESGGDRRMSTDVAAPEHTSQDGVDNGFPSLTRRQTTIGDHDQYQNSTLKLKSEQDERTSNRELESARRDDAPENIDPASLSTPDAQKGYFDIRNDRDRRGKAKGKGPATTVTSRSRTSTSSSFKSVPTNTPGTRLAFPNPTDPLFTPTSETGKSGDGDDELTDDEGFVECWPAEPEVRRQESFEKQSSEPEAEATSALMSSKSPSKTIDDLPPLVPLPADPVATAADWKKVASIVQPQDPAHTLEGATSPPERENANIGRVTITSGDSCIDQFVQQFNGVVEQGMKHAELKRGESGGSSGGGGKSPRTISLIGSAGTLGDDTHSSRHMTDSPLEGIEGTLAPSNWKSFMKAYKNGRWDPNQTPVLPQATNSSLDRALPSSRSSPGQSFTSIGDAMRDTRSPIPDLKLDNHAGAFGIASLIAQPTLPLAQVASGSSTSTSPVTSPTPTGLHLDPARLRRWTGDDTKYGRGSSLKNISNLQNSDNEKKGASHASLAAGAATMILASQNYRGADFDPLGIPSPERELTDPLANFATGDKQRKQSSSSDSGIYQSLARNQTGHSEGNMMESRFKPLATIIGSPAASPCEEYPPSIQKQRTGEPSERKSTYNRNAASQSLAALKHIPPASAPVEWGSSDNQPTDYFAGATLTENTAFMPFSPANSANSSHPSVSRTSSAQTVLGYTNNDFNDFVDPLQIGDDQTPSESRPKPSLIAHRSHGESSSRLARTKVPFLSNEAPASLQRPPETPVDKEEAYFQEHGYLLAPKPSDDLARRKALYRFKVLHTARDVNFDRIAHLVQLVFSTKIVLISLVDEHQNWHKVDHGLGQSTVKREDSFCSHVVLSKNDEPMVILDSHKDWRFRQHPFVVAKPNIRFYAGAPLRTSDGHNIGSLCIIDDKPRLEFPPRSRMALKEFAAVLIREMELWRDKTRLKARDRAQTSMEKFTRDCLELDLDPQNNAARTATSMEHMYENASKLVQATLDLEGALVLDLSHFEFVEGFDAAGRPTRMYQADPYDMGSMASEDEHHVPENAFGDPAKAFGPLPPWVVMGSAEGDSRVPDRTRHGSSNDHARFSDFLQKYPEGRIYEQVVPSWIRHMLPQSIHYAMIVPIFNLDNHPFALLCAYTSDKTKEFLEGYELQFLRAIGVVILSAVLKRRMVLADKAKSNFISNISHELRTPLHGILAAAELLSDTTLDNNQKSFLSTVQACGTSLIETVNHVLDFTKLSGNAKGTMENNIKLGSVNLAHLVEETVEGCWIGQRARAQQGQSEIGSFYSPPSPSATTGRGTTGSQTVPHVETVIDIGFREGGWQVKCEKGGIRRVLMNLIGNSLKFTRDGYIQVTLRELPHTPGSTTIPIEMAVIDTGKGISRSFLKDQLFHPFSQENPHQTGTGLGLAIVNSIVRSDSVNGKVDVWSVEGFGTEIKVTLDVELERFRPSHGSSLSVGTSTSSDTPSSLGSYFGKEVSLTLANFDSEHRGSKLNKEIVSSYATWWGFAILADELGQQSDIIVSDEEGELLRQLLENNDVTRPVLILSASRIARPTASMMAYQKAGGFVQMVFKPVGPQRFQLALRAAVESISQTPGTGSVRSNNYFSPIQSPGSEASWVSGPGLGRAESTLDDHRPFGITRESSSSTIGSPMVEFPRGPLARQWSILQAESNPALVRRRSDDDRGLTRTLHRPTMSPRSTTFQDSRPSIHAVVGRGRDAESADDHPSIPGSPTSMASTLSTLSLADGGFMLKKSKAPPEDIGAPGKPKLMLVDDNFINLKLLSAYCKKKGIDHEQCVNGQLAVDKFSDGATGRYDIILMDLSMPVMDGIEATRTIRKVEADRRAAKGDHMGSDKALTYRCKIFALSGRATAEDKKEAFAAGVDGYLVKPVKLATLDAIIKRLGF